MHLAICNPKGQKNEHKRCVIPTEANHSLIVIGEVEEPPHFAQSGDADQQEAS
jgi:hypothetical protein